MPKRIAAIDLGTNTFHLLIADVSDREIKEIVCSEQIHVKLGEGGINNGTITQDAFKRGLEALSRFKELVIQHHAEKIRAVGTAALRTAHNGAEFINQVKEKTGFDILIIDGDWEASLIYQGVRQAINLTESSLIMDIGGGSVEFIIADAAGILWKKSYPIGAAKLMAAFHHSDPISDTDIKAISHHLDEVLADLKRNAIEFNPKLLIGSAGAFETFAALCQIKTDGKPPDIKKSFTFDGAQLDAVISDILSSNHTQRVNNPAILPVRTDMIVVAAVLTRYVIKALEIESVKLSTFALKEGLLFDDGMKF